MHAGGRRSAAAGKASTSRFAIQCNLEPQDEGDGGSVAAPGSGRPETLTAGSAEWHALGELEYPIRLAIAECREETSHMDLAVCAMLKNMANSTAYTQWFRFQRRSDRCHVRRTSACRWRSATPACASRTLPASKTFGPGQRAASTRWRRTSASWALGHQFHDPTISCFSQQTRGLSRNLEPSLLRTDRKTLVSYPNKWLPPLIVCSVMTRPRMPSIATRPAPGAEVYRWYG